MWSYWTGSPSGIRCPVAKHLRPCCLRIIALSASSICRLRVMAIPVVRKILSELANARGDWQREIIALGHVAVNLQFDRYAPLRVTFSTRLFRLAAFVRCRICRTGIRLFAREVECAGSRRGSFRDARVVSSPGCAAWFDVGSGIAQIGNCRIECLDRAIHFCGESLHVELAHFSERIALHPCFYAGATLG